MMWLLFSDTTIKIVGSHTRAFTFIYESFSGHKEQKLTMKSILLHVHLLLAGWQSWQI